MAESAHVRAVTRRTQQQRSELTRRRILDATFELLKEKGVSGFRIADVALRAGVSRGALVHHFRSKDALVAQRSRAETATSDHT